ncbi:1366_t:CDS:2 [Entrophospora sp. SA101]|nr:11786_t:CDS:2 [Entrophospora sp. SA101]CAJ0630772.1 1366_t:CDS:2 [Entrophospora sp. SA101]CAJ0825613.1 6489_t:CDS:2 [Entrophospora sp. SA101]CAJ0842380.1 15296_t:CDS:2 [Entrophospora sp. SA101]
MSTITTTTTTTTPSKFFHITAFNSSPISTTTPGSSSPTATTTILASHSPHLIHPIFPTMITIPFTTSHEYDHINYNTKPHHHRIRRSSATTKFVRFATIIDDVNHDADDSGSITSSTCSSIDGDDFDVEGDEFFFPNSDFVVPSKIS